MEVVRKCNNDAIRANNGESQECNNNTILVNNGGSQECNNNGSD